VMAKADAMKGAVEKVTMATGLWGGFKMAKEILGF